MKKYDAVIAGYTCVDMFPKFHKNRSETSVSDLLKPGKLIEIDGVDYILGGAVPNTGLAMKKFNNRVFLNGLTGIDFMGKMVMEYLGNYDLSEGMATVPDSGTALSIVLAPKGVDRIFLESPGCSRIFGLSYIKREAVSRSRLFHFGYPPLLPQFYLKEGEQLSMMFSEINQMGTITSLDFSLPDPESESGKVNWLQIMKKTLPFVDIFLPSLEEALYIMMPDQYKKISVSSGGSDIVKLIPLDMIRQIGDQLIKAGVKILIIKAGEKGIYLKTGDVSSINKKSGRLLIEKDWNFLELWCNVYTAETEKIINNCGAGDTAIAAFLTAILKGEHPEMALKYAAMAGRNNLYCRNIYSDLKDWETMKKEMNEEDNEIVKIAY